MYSALKVRCVDYCMTMWQDLLSRRNYSWKFYLNMLQLFPKGWYLTWKHNWDCFPIRLRPLLISVFRFATLWMLFLNQWVGRCGPIACPSRSPSLTPMNSFICRCVITLPMLSKSITSDTFKILHSCGTITLHMLCNTLVKTE